MQPCEYLSVQRITVKAGLMYPVEVTGSFLYTVMLTDTEKTPLCFPVSRYFLSYEHFDQTTSCGESPELEQSGAASVLKA